MAQANSIIVNIKENLAASILTEAPDTAKQQVKILKL
jgi:hypothetical protein